MSTSKRVVLLRDPASAEAPGRCCWWQAVQAAFTAAGADLQQVWLPRPRSRRLASTPRVPEATAGAVRDADVVLAETPAAVQAAARMGAPRRRLWAVVLPSGHTQPGDEADAAGAAAVAGLAGGFLTDGEPARESVERALATVRPHVMVLPVPDQRCPECAGTHLRPPVPRSPWDGGAPAADAADEPESPGTAGAWDAAVHTAHRVLAAAATPPGSPSRAVRSALVTGFDLRFAADLADRLDQRADLDVRVDPWPGVGRRSRRTARWSRRAETVVAEWARPNATWLSRRKRPGQFLVVRLHRYELDSPYPPQIAAEQVDAMVYIAPHIGRRIRDELGWPAEKLLYIPNFLDVDWLDRSKVPAARFTLGIVGVDVSRKRFDLALDLLAAVRRVDPRYALRVRSTLPWHNRYMWDKPHEREYARWCFSRIERDPLLREAVIFDPPGRDMARWYRQVGYILSTSDAEGSHAALAEGMASGAVPVVRPWHGAEDLYDPTWVHPTTDEAAQRVITCADSQVWAEHSTRARAEVRRSHDPRAVVAAWAELLHGDLAAARSRTVDPAGTVVATDAAGTVAAATAPLTVTTREGTLW